MVSSFVSLLFAFGLCFFACAVDGHGQTFRTGFTTSGTVNVGGGSVSQSGTVETKQYTVPANFVKILNEARADTSGGVPTIVQNADGTISIRLNLSSGTKTYTVSNKSLLSLFVELYRNPQLKVKVLSQQGSNVVISVSSDDSLSSSSTSVSSDVLNLIQSLGTNSNIRILSINSQDGKTYTIKYSDGNEVKTLTGVPANAAQLIESKSKDPNLKLHVSGDGSQQNVKLDYGSGTQQVFSVKPIFLQVLNNIRKNPNTQINVQRVGNTFTLKITSGSQTQTYKNINPQLLSLLKLLVNNPQVNIKVTPDADGKLTIVLPSSVHITSPSTVHVPDLVTKLENVLNNPSYSVRLQPTDDGQYELIINDGTDEKKYKISSSDASVVYNLLNKRPSTQPGQTSILPETTPGSGSVVTDQPTDTGSTSHPVEPDFLDLIEKLTEEPDLNPKYEIHPTSNGLYDITVTIGSTTKTYKNIQPRLLKAFTQIAGGQQPDVTTNQKPGQKPQIDIPTDPTPETHEVSNPQVEILNTVKSAPDLKISVTPTKPNHYDITLTDDEGPKTYHDVPLDFLVQIIDARNNKDLPFEILPGDKPGHQNVKIPDPHSPDVLNFEVQPAVLDVTNALKHEPESQLTITPDKKGTYTVTIESDGKKKDLPNLPSSAVDTIVRLRTDDDLPFYLVPGKHGKITLVVPKEELEPVKVQLTPKLLSLIKDLRTDHQHTSLTIKPEKSGKYNLVVNRHDKDNEYPHIPADLVPILNHIFTVPDAEFDIKPGKGNTIEFVPSTLTPDTDRFKVDYNVVDIITILRRNPSATLNIQPDDDGQFTITVNDGDEKKKYKHVSPEGLRLISDLQTHPSQPFSLKPTKDGNVVVITPKTSRKDSTVRVSPDTKNIIETIRKNPDIDLTIEPDPSSGDFNINLGGKKYRGISPDLLLLLTTLLSKPTLSFKVEPSEDGDLNIVIPKTNPKTIDLTLSIEQVDILNELKRNPDVDVTVKRNKKGSVDVDLDIKGKTYRLPHLKPNVADLLITLVTSPTLPFNIYSENGEYTLIAPKRPGDLTFKNIPDVVLDLIKDKKLQKTPNLKLKIDKVEPGDYNVKIYDGNKLIKSLPDSDTATTQLLGLIVTNPNLELTVETDRHGNKVVKTAAVDTTTVSFPIDASSLKPIQLAKNPNVKSIKVKHSTDKKFDVSVNVDDEVTSFNNLDADIVNIIVLLQTRNNLEIDIYVGNDGSFSISVPKSALRTTFDGITKSFFDIVSKIQPKADVTSFTLKPNTRHTQFDLDVSNPSLRKNLPHLPGIEVELLVNTILFPFLKPQIASDVDGLLTITVSKHIPHLIFKNVKPKFLQLAKEVQANQQDQVAISRNGGLTLVVIHDKHGLQLKNADPIVVLLFVSLFADPNFHYKSHLESDGSVTLVTQKYNRFQVFYDVKPSLFSIVSQLTSARQPVLLISHAPNGGYAVAITLDGRKTQALSDLSIEDLRLIVLSISYKGLQFKQIKSSKGKLDIEVTLPKTKDVYDFNLFQIVVNVVKDVANLFGGVLGTLAQSIGSILGGIFNLGKGILEGLTGTATNILSGGEVHSSGGTTTTTHTSSGGLLGGLLGGGTSSGTTTTTTHTSSGGLLGGLIGGVTNTVTGLFG